MKQKHFVLNGSRQQCCHTWWNHVITDPLPWLPRERINVLQCLLFYTYFLGCFFCCLVSFFGILFLSTFQSFSSWQLRWWWYLFLKCAPHFLLFQVSPSPVSNWSQVTGFVWWLVGPDLGHCLLFPSYCSDSVSLTGSHDPVQPPASVIGSSSYVGECNIWVSDLLWIFAQRPAVTPRCTAGVAAEALAEPTVPVQLFANDLRSCVLRRKRVE